MKIDTRLILESVSMEQVVGLYVNEPIKKHFISCPFHNEKTPSLRIYENTFYCFGCGVGGDVIRFTRHYFNLSFMDAIHKIDSDFGLIMFNKPTLTQHLRRKEEQENRKKEREILQIQLEESRIGYNKMCQYHRWLIKQPETPDIKFQTEYIERLLDQFLDPNIIIPFDVTAWLNALKTKFCSIEEVDAFATNC